MQRYRALEYPSGCTHVYVYIYLDVPISYNWSYGFELWSVVFPFYIEEKGRGKNFSHISRLLRTLRSSVCIYIAVGGGGEKNN